MSTQNLPYIQGSDLAILYAKLYLNLKSFLITKSKLSCTCAPENFVEISGNYVIRNSKVVRHSSTALSPFRTLYYLRSSTAANLKSVAHVSAEI